MIRDEERCEELVGNGSVHIKYACQGTRRCKNKATKLGYKDMKPCTFHFNCWEKI